MAPLPGTLHVDKVLTQFSIAYTQERTQFIADRVFPSIPVDFRSDKYRVYPKEWWLRTFAEKRAPATESKGVTWQYSEDSYFAEKYSVHTDVPDEDRDNQDADLDVFADATDLVTEQILLKREKDFIANYLATGVWGTDVDVSATSTAWTSSATATPLNDVDNNKLAVHRTTGRMPNTGVLAWPTFLALKYCDQILDRIVGMGGNADPANVTLGIMAQLFGLDRMFLAGVVENTANQGAAENTDLMLTDGFWMGYVEPRPSQRRPSAGYTFKWRRAAGSVNGRRVKRIPLPKHDAERVEADDFRDDKVVAPDLGVFFHNTGA